MNCLISRSLKLIFSSLIFSTILMMFPKVALSKQITFTFDDAPTRTTVIMNQEERANRIISALKLTGVNGAGIFANPCKEKDASLLAQHLRKYQKAGHIIGNHTCSHLKLSDVGATKFIADSDRAQTMLRPVVSGQKYFRFPYLDEVTEEVERNKVRQWLTQNRYLNAPPSIDSGDTIISNFLLLAREREMKFDEEKIRSLYVQHIVNAAEFYEELAVKQLGYSPNHILLLHENDAAALYLTDVIKALKNNGWTFLSLDSAIADPLYLQPPTSTQSLSGIIAQKISDKSENNFRSPHDWSKLEGEVRSILGFEPMPKLSHE